MGQSYSTGRNCCDLTSGAVCPSPRRRWCQPLVVLGLGLLQAGDLLAGSFTVQPVRVFIGKQQPTSRVKIFNEKGEPISLQLNAFAWSQDAEGNDVEEPTEEVIFFPKIFRLEKNKSQIVRIGLVDPKPTKQERTYRIYFRELPVKKEHETTTLKVMLRIGVPLFLAPLESAPAAVVEELSLGGCQIKFKAHNTGTVHLQWKKIEVTALGKAGKVHTENLPGWYVLSGRTKSYKVDLAKEICPKVVAAKVYLEADELSVDGETKRAAGDQP